MVAPSNPVAFTFASPGTGRNAGVFRPPKSPASTASSPAVATATDYFTSGSRKRPRADSSQARPVQTPRSRPKRAQCPTPEEGGCIARAQQDSSWVNDRYDLAGGFDTPSLQATAAMMRLREDDQVPGIGRPTREAGLVDSSNASHMSLDGPLARERNGAARIPTSQNHEQDNPSWTYYAFDLVGKVFNFGSNVIKGFYSGGGKGYNLAHNAGEHSSFDFQAPGCSTPLPGAWAEDGSVFDFDDRQDWSAPDPAMTRPMNKRRQTDKEAWVYVSKAPESPKRANWNTPPVRPTASRAASRRSLAPTPSRRQSYMNAPLPSPARSNVDRRASLAPMRSPSSKNDLPRQTYFSPEAERYVRRQAKQDKAADKAIYNMSRQLEDLIRQGQEALGTKISIGAETDEGFADEN